VRNALNVTEPILTKKTVSGIVAIADMNGDLTLTKRLVVASGKDTVRWIEKIKSLGGQLGGVFETGISVKRTLAQGIWHGGRHL
jgi:hypothetical protein